MKFVLDWLLKLSIHTQRSIQTTEAPSIEYVLWTSLSLVGQSVN